MELSALAVGEAIDTTRTSSLREPKLTSGDSYEKFDLRDFGMTFSEM